MAAPPPLRGPAGRDGERWMLGVWDLDRMGVSGSECRSAGEHGDGKEVEMERGDGAVTGLVTRRVKLAGVVGSLMGLGVRSSTN